MCRWWRWKCNNSVGTTINGMSLVGERLFEELMGVSGGNKVVLRDSPKWSFCAIFLTMSTGRFSKWVCLTSFSHWSKAFVRTHLHLFPRNQLRRETKQKMENECTDRQDQ